MFMTTDVRARRGWKSILFLAINNSNEWIGDGYLSTHHSTLGSNSNICFAFILLREITVAGADTSRMPVQDRVLFNASILKLTPLFLSVSLLLSSSSGFVNIIIRIIK